MNVTGSDRTSLMVRDLSPGTLYSFTVQAYNPQGVSRPSVPPLTATTQGTYVRLPLESYDVVSLACTREESVFC